MRIISRKTLKEFWDQHPDAQQPLQAWYHDTKHAIWKSPADIKDVYRNASFIADNRVVFNIKGNRYRLDTKVYYQRQIVMVKRIGTHAEYEGWRF